MKYPKFRSHASLVIQSSNCKVVAFQVPGEAGTPGPTVSSSSAPYFGVSSKLPALRPSNVCGASPGLPLRRGYRELPVRRRKRLQKGKSDQAVGSVKSYRMVQRPGDWVGEALQNGTVTRRLVQ